MALDIHRGLFPEKNIQGDQVISSLLAETSD
jgi:hypothetical protein